MCINRHKNKCFWSEYRLRSNKLVYLTVWKWKKWPRYLTRYSTMVFVSSFWYEVCMIHTNYFSISNNNSKLCTQYILIDVMPNTHFKTFDKIQNIIGLHYCIVFIFNVSICKNIAFGFFLQITIVCLQDKSKNSTY